MYVVMNSERVEELREEKGLSKRDLADGSGPIGVGYAVSPLLAPQMLDLQTDQYDAQDEEDCLQGQNKIGEHDFLSVCLAT